MPRVCQLRTLIKVSNSFEKVFSSLSVIAENWGAINDFRSTYRRLREFEAKLYPPVKTFGWRAPRITDGGSNAGTQLSEVRPRGETVHEVLGEPVPESNYDRGGELRVAGAASSSGRRASRNEIQIYTEGPAPADEMRV